MLRIGLFRRRAGRFDLYDAWIALEPGSCTTPTEDEKRAPYFHNGTAATLDEVFLHYHQALGFQFTPEQRAALVAFLRAL